MWSNRDRIWIAGFALILAVCNLHLLTNTEPTIFLFDTNKVVNGEWWRAITHPFVHVSWYHLLLDCGAILLLWKEIRLRSQMLKLLAVAICGAASLVFSLLSSSAIHHYGLCGLSGTAHGLTFLVGLVWLSEAKRGGKKHRNLLVVCGLFLIFATGGKSLIEIFTGKVIFSDLHVGDLGIPIVESHLGGVIGGALAALVLWAMKYKPFDLTPTLTDNSNKDTTASGGETDSNISAEPEQQ